MAELHHPRLHRSFHRAIAGFVIGPRRAIQHFADQLADLAEFRLTKAARGAGGRAKAHTRCHHRLFGVKGNGVLVAGQMRAIERRFRDLAGQLLWPQINQQQMIIRATRHQIQALRLQFARQRLGIGDDLARIGAEFRAQRFTEGNRLGRDYMH